MSARTGIFNYLTGRAICHTPRSADEAEGLLDAYRAEVLREAKGEVTSWLAKKAGEYGTSNRENRATARAVGRLASKVDRGAIRLFLAAEEKASATTDCACGPQFRCKNGHCSRHYLCQDCGNCCACRCSTGGEKASALAVAATPRPVVAPSDGYDLTKIGPARSIDVTPISDGLLLDLVATRDEWKAWADALDVDAARTTHRGCTVTSHATWRGIHIAIRCHYTGGAK